MTRPDLETWSANDYEIIQMILNVPAQYKAVWAFLDNDDDPDDPCHLEALPIEALAVAECITSHYRRPVGSKEAGTVYATEKHNTIVVLECVEGWWQVANEANNFAGIMRDGQDIADCCGELDHHYRDRLSREPPPPKSQCPPKRAKRPGNI